MRYEYSTMTEALRSEQPTVLAQSFDLSRSTQAVVWLSNIRVYSFGLMVSVSVLTRELDANLILGQLDLNQKGAQTPVSLGVEFADGRSLTLDGPTQEGVVLEVRDAFSGEGSLQANVLLAPIPPPGPLRFVAAIPGLDVPKSGAILDGNHIAAESGNVERLWTATRTPNG